MLVDHHSLAAIEIQRVRLLCGISGATLPGSPNENEDIGGGGGKVRVVDGEFLIRGELWRGTRSPGRMPGRIS